MDTRNWIIVLIHAFIGWVLCFATMGIGMAVLPLNQALIVHAIAAPIIFTVISSIYFTKYNFINPIQAAGIFVGFVIIIDFLIVALLINRSLEMFLSIIGTWLPFTLIFFSTLITGTIIRARK